MKRVVVIGGGITGLAAANALVERRLSPDSFEVMLLEASSRLGGTIRSEWREGFLIEHGPDSFISEKPAAIDLSKRIGLEPHLIQTNSDHRRSFIVRDGRLLPVPEGFQLLAPTRIWPFIASDIFSWSGKARMALDLFLPRAKANGDADESLARFVRRRLGREALERMAQPMVGGIYTADPEKLSLRATLPRFLEIEQSDRSLILGMLRRSKQSPEQSKEVSGARYALFLSFDGGMQLLTDHLASKLEHETKLDHKVNRLSFDGSSKTWTIELQGQPALRAESIILALPAYTSASLVREFHASLATALETIPYESTATVNLAFRRDDVRHPLNGFGFVVPFVEKRSILACTFSSVKFAGRAPEGAVLLRAFVGGALQPEMFALDEDEMLTSVQNDLKELLGVVGLPLFTTVTKWHRSMPQYHLGHLELVKQIRTLSSQLPGFELAGNAYGGAGIPDCISSGESAANSIVEGLSPHPQ